jgi:hypothetical protein
MGNFRRCPCSMAGRWGKRLAARWYEDWLLLEQCLRYLLATGEELGETAQTPE